MQQLKNLVDVETIKTFGCHTRAKPRAGLRCSVRLGAVGCDELIVSLQSLVVATHISLLRVNQVPQSGVLLCNKSCHLHFVLLDRCIAHSSQSQLLSLSRHQSRRESVGNL